MKTRFFSGVALSVLPVAALASTLSVKAVPGAYFTNSTSEDYSVSTDKDVGCDGWSLPKVLHANTPTADAAGDNDQVVTIVSSYEAPTDCAVDYYAPDGTFCEFNVHLDIMDDSVSFDGYSAPGCYASGTHASIS